ncbi:vitelline envelope sperm lysin receptor-like isoform X1 [Haliotis rubra]|uniref:vitelline envelope sperm lysin receptor-like isoform X1 n=1 Tax=Haliotis rubra TaxID=36100 RepID=UPI001EE552DE|nr:vitelline envelope sperm lysin receptor-like isoform X1 [Haliotis rubra]
MVFYIRLAIVVTFLVSVYGGIPESYNLKVSTNCGKDHVADAVVTVLTDLPRAFVFAKCATGSADFTSSDGTTYKLPVSFPGKGTSKCKFLKRKGVDTYVLTVVVAYGEDDDQVQQSDQIYTITCTFDPNALDDSAKQTIEGSLAAPRAVEVDNGPDTSSSVKLTIADILGNDLDPGEPLTLGRKIILKIKTDGTSKEVGISPWSCDVVGSNPKQRYAVLRAGCGDGIVFPRHSGFTTKGLTATGPFFDSFTLPGEKTLVFECKVTLCSTPCNGNSCGSKRGRRDVHGIFENKITLRSTRFQNLEQ